MSRGRALAVVNADNQTESSSVYTENTLNVGAATSTPTASISSSSSSIDNTINVNTTAGVNTMENQRILNIDDVTDKGADSEILYIKRSLKEADKTNERENEELVNSLMEKISILEKEKEALRTSAARNIGSAEVLRSCAREQRTINELSSKLEEVRVDRVNILRDLQIKEDQCLPMELDDNFEEEIINPSIGNLEGENDEIL